MVLADEINRTPPKTQAALLEAMQEHQVTAAGVRHTLVEPFFVLATQNPIEMEGTYPLPEAQLDRFMFNVVMDYLPEDEEVAVVTRTTSEMPAPIAALFTGEDVLRFHEIVRKVPVAEEIVRYAVKLAAARDGRDHIGVGIVGNRPWRTHLAEHVDSAGSGRGKIKVVVWFQRHVLGKIAVHKKFFEIHRQAVATPHEETMREIGRLDVVHIPADDLPAPHVLDDV